MTIEKNFSNNVTTIKINGRLDTTTAPELESVIDECVEGTHELLMDFISYTQS